MEFKKKRKKMYSGNKNQFFVKKWSKPPVEQQLKHLKLIK